MRKLLTAVILAASAGLVACGGGDGGGGGGSTGGSGGSGATGGAGGAGGTGGAGGGETGVCGDGVVDDGEDCDEGDTQPGDGCSPECTFEQNSCATPLNFNAVGQLDANRIRVHQGKLPAASSTFEASCGGDGAEVFYSYTAGNNGNLIWGAAPAGQIVVSLHSDCADTSNELACNVASGQINAGQLRVEKDQVLYFVIDSQATAQEIEYALGAILVPVFQEGETCPSPNLPPEQYGACDEGLRCASVNFEWVCVPNNAPTITGATANRVGNDLIFSVDGGDEDGDATGVNVKFRDQAGDVIPLEGIQPTPVEEVFIAFDPAVTGRKTFTGGRTIEGFFQAIPAAAAAVRLDITLVDSGKMTSDTIQTELVRPPLVGEGEGCDPEGLLNRCADDQLCETVDVAPVCVTLQTLRVNACGDAAVATVGGLHTGNVTGGARSLYEPPASCGVEQWGYPGLLPESLVKIVLESDVASLTISTESENTLIDTVLYVYAGCGEDNGAGLACNDDVDVNTGNFLSRVELTNVAAGEYLVVVDTWPNQDGTTGGAFDLTVTAE